MKGLFAVLFAVAFALAPVKKAEASYISTSVVVGVVVASYAGTLAGVAASSVLAGTVVLMGSAKEVAIKAARNDVQNFYSSGALTLTLENSIKSLQALDESISQEEAMDMIMEATK